MAPVDLVRSPGLAAVQAVHRMQATPPRPADITAVTRGDRNITDGVHALRCRRHTCPCSDRGPASSSGSPGRGSGQVYRPTRAAGSAPGSDLDSVSRWFPSVRVRASAPTRLHVDSDSGIRTWWGCRPSRIPNRACSQAVGDQPTDGHSPDKSPYMCPGPRPVHPSGFCTARVADPSAPGGRSCPGRESTPRTLVDDLRHPAG